MTLNPKAVPLLGNARTACMLFFLQVHGRSLLGTSLPSLRLCLSAKSRQGQGDASCTSSFARGLWRYSRHSIIHGSLCRSTPCLAGGPECRRTAGNKPCMLLWDLAGAGQHKHQVWQKSDFMGGKQECACDRNKRPAISDTCDGWPWPMPCCLLTLEHTAVDTTPGTGMQGAACDIYTN